MLITRWFFIAALFPIGAAGHHSQLGRYDTQSIAEIQGLITELAWRNPHAFFVVETDEGVSWRLETGSASHLQRAGILPDTIAIGDRVKVAGRPPLTSRREMYITNLLSPSGDEFLMDIDIGPRWTTEGIGDRSFWYQSQGDSSRGDLGLFRVWSHTFQSSWLFPEILEPNFDLGSYPLTPAAREQLANYDKATDNPTINCTPKGMPTIMEQPYPQEFVYDGENIVLRIEEYDVRRTIHMNQNAAPDGTPNSPLGYSIGRWDGDALVVTTTHLNWPWFNQLGIPQSEQSVLVETFTPTSDGSRLDYQLTVTDPVNFTEPVTLEKYWLYLPEEEIKPYNCTIQR